MKRRHGSFLAASLLILAVSCATKPKGPVTFDSGDFALLAPGGSVYCAVNVAASRLILDNLSLEGINGRDMAQVLDRTDSAVAAFYPPESGRSFMAAARGRYSFGTMFFSSASGWKKQKSVNGGSYWYSAARKISVSLKSRLAQISDRDPFLKAPGAEVPEGFALLTRNAAMAGWVNNAGEHLDRLFENLGIPLQIPAERLLFGIYAVSDEGAPGTGAPGYEAVVRLETPSAGHARGLVNLISMVGALAASAEGFPEAIAPFFAQRPQQDEAALIIRTGIMSEAQITLLFNLFSVNSSSHADL
ncbi:hypothetical protein AGMMS49928_14210 [Spirochaetia bacterium]|nr:hypothetical protein AGMMS49928_14210 [Spirochaetia bacterium]